jgi:hypothetical protein
MWTGSIVLVVLLPSGFLFAEDLKDVCLRVCPVVKRADAGFCILTAPLFTVHCIHTDSFLGIVRVLRM